LIKFSIRLCSLLKKSGRWPRPRLSVLELLSLLCSSMLPLPPWRGSKAFLARMIGNGGERPSGETRFRMLPRHSRRSQQVTTALNRQGRLLTISLAEVKSEWKWIRCRLSSLSPTSGKSHWLCRIAQAAMTPSAHSMCGGTMLRLER
jgi:hypothetical protein